MTQWLPQPPERSRNTVLVTSIQVHYLSHHTVQYGAHSFTDSSESGSASRVARSFGSGKLYICLSNKCFKVYPVYSLCDRHKTLTGSPDPTYMQPADKPCTPKQCYWFYVRATD